jgi:hypothetical protein
MKKVFATLILIAMSISFVAPCFIGADNNDKTDVAAQTITTKINNTQYAGITKTITDSFKKSGAIEKKKKNKVDVVTESEEKTNQEKTKDTTEYDGWTTTTVNIRKSPSTSSDVLDTLPFNTHITYTIENSNWFKIAYDDDCAYISAKYVVDSECSSKTYDIPSNRGFKSYMSYKAITSKSSKQYKLQHTYAYTGTYGIRQVNGRFCVAIGTAFNAEIGTYFDLILKNGTVIPCIVSDVKAKKDTKSDNITTASNGCVSEFLVDMSSLNRNAKRDGDISSCTKEWDSSVVQIKIYKRNIFDE